MLETILGAEDVTVNNKSKKKKRQKHLPSWRLNSSGEKEAIHLINKLIIYAHEKVITAMENTE